MSQLRLSCILLANRKESIKDTLKAIIWASIIKSLRNLSNAVGGAESTGRFC